MRFALTVPTRHRSHRPAGRSASTSTVPVATTRRTIGDGTAGRLAAQGIAVISTDQVLAGPRDPAGTDPGVAFFNFGNPLAGRDNALQGAADAWSQMRLAFGLDFSGRRRRDRERRSRAAVVLRPLAGRPHRTAVRRVRAGADRRRAVGHRRPALPVDAVQDATRSTFRRSSRRSPAIRRWTRTTRRSRSRRCGSSAPTARTTRASWCASRSSLPTASRARTPRSIFQSEGFVDTYAPNPAIEAFATSLAGDIVMLPAEKDVRRPRRCAGERRPEHAADRGQPERRHGGARAIHAIAELRRSLRRVRHPERREAIGGVPRHARRDRHRHGSGPVTTVCRARSSGRC